MWLLALFLLPATLILEANVARGDVTSASTSTTRPAIQPSVSLDRTDASGFHFKWNFQEVFGSTIKKIELFAVPVNSDLGVANVSTVVFSNATSGSITTGLRPY
uniref:Secreted protein n=1 Tax=Mesocestoides corti TaxID=53468 RepID=A0A5K3F5N0_MESCO